MAIDTLRATNHSSPTNQSTSVLSAIETDLRQRTAHAIEDEGKDDPGRDRDRGQDREAQIDADDADHNQETVAAIAAAVEGKCLREKSTSF